MQLTLLKSKIHRAAVTGASVDYEGSLTISTDLAELVGLLPCEKFWSATQATANASKPTQIYGEARRGMVELNGATAHLGKSGDRLTIMSFARYTPEEAAIHRPRILLLNENNQMVRYEEGDSEPGLRVVGN